MKILYGITKSEPFGGAQRYVFELAIEAKKRGHNVKVLCGGEGTLTDKLRAEKVRVITSPYLQRDISIIKECKSFLFTIKTLRQEQPDVFHINSSKMGGLGALAGRCAGIRKTIFTAHGWAFNEPRPIWQKLLIKTFVWLTIILSHKTICVSEGTASDIKKWPFVSKKLILIRNGISEFQLDKRTSDSFTVGTIAELHKIKGLDILLLAWSKFIKKREAVLVIFGEGTEKKNLENMARKLDILDSVIFKGFIKDARKLLSSFDIFVLPSRSEALPYALLEAGISERAVIATSVGGIPEIIENGITGILVPKEDPEIIFSSLVLLAEDANLRKRLGTNLKSSILEKFSFKKMVDDTLKAYV